MSGRLRARWFNVPARRVLRSRSLVAVVVLALAVSVVQALSFAAAPHASRALASAADGFGGRYVPLQERILNTQAASSIGGNYTTPMPPNAWRTIKVEGDSDGNVTIPSSGVEAVAVNFTVVSPAAAGLIHADHGGGTPNSTVTYMNYLAGSTQSNSAVISLLDSDSIQVLASTSVDLVIDVQGYYTAGDPAAGGYVPISPVRLVDTRNGTGLPQAKLAAGSTSTIQASGFGGIPAGASGVMANISIVNQSKASWYRTWAADQPQPGTAMDFDASIDSNTAQIGLSTTGTPVGAFKFYDPNATLDLVVDIVGYYTATTTTGAFTPAATRVLDTRLSGQTSIAAGTTRVVQVTGVAGVPLAGAGLSAVVTNMAVADAASTGSRITVWANGTSEPASANSVHYLTGVTSNMITSNLGSDGALAVHNYGTMSIDLIVNVEGWFANTGTAIPNGQDQTQQSVTLQAPVAGTGSYMTYKYRVGTVSAFSQVPVANVKDGNGNSPSAWPVAASGGSFPAYTWNIRNTLIAAGGSAPDSLIQVVACYGATSTDSSPVCGMPSNVDFAQSAFGDGFATTDLGPGSLAELTGDFEIDATDAGTASSLDGLSLGRTLTTLAPADAGVSAANQRTDASGVFGPGWTAELSGPESGNAQLKVTDQAAAGYVLFTDTDGGVDTYQATSPTGTYPISFAPTGAAGGNGETVVKTNASVITMTDPDGTLTTWTKTGSSWPVSSVTEPGSNSTASYTYNAAGLPTRILAPIPNGMSCSAPDTTPGCRSLTLAYTSLTVSGTSVTRLASIAESIPQTSGTANSITLAKYDYTTGGLLADEYDPRITPALKTAYTYNSAGRLATLTPPGLAAYTFGYDATGRLSTISRPDPSGSTATSTVAYGLPLSGSGLPDVTASTAATWDETRDLPVTGTAVFDPDHVPAASPSSSDWPYAGIDYLDVNGEQVNSAAYGAGAWQVDTTQLDANGNDVWDLSAGNRAQALAPTSDTDTYVAGLSSNVARADLLGSSTTYNPLDPGEVTDTYGPTHPVTLRSGSVTDARTHVSTSYDEGAPNGDVNPATGAAYDLQTTVTTAVTNVATNVDTGYPDNQVTHYGYAAINSGDPDGWTLNQPTTSTVQMGSSPSSADLVTTTRYDANGRTIEQRLPNDSSGTTPRTTLTTYYTTAGTGACGDPTRAGLVCSTAPAAQPATGSPLPVVSYTYDRDGDPTSKIETYGTGSGQVVRTTSTGYDTADRKTSSSITVTPTSAGGTAVPAVAYSYDSNTGLSNGSSTGTGPGIVSLSSGYDTVGEQTSYTDATGNVSTKKYDLDGRLTSLNDGKGTTTYTYDSSSEHRGVPTSEDIGVTGSPSAFAASYDTAGNMANETYPNGLVATRHYDNAGDLTSLAYAKSGSTWMTFTQNVNALGQISKQASPQSSQVFTYDPDDRLTTVQDTYSGSCTTRAYAFDAHSNRTNLTSTPASSGPTCSTSTTPTTTSYHYDDADRLTSDTAGTYAYDTLGRATSIPAGDAQGIGSHASITGTATIGYDANDMVASEQQGSTTDTFTLDPDQNRLAAKTEGSSTTTDHYSDDTDSPTWTATGSASWTRNLAGIDGGLGATVDQTGTVTLQLANPHGDIVSSSSDATTATAVLTYSEFTEYGSPRTPSAATSSYGWLGAAQRSSDSLGGLTLMGARLYDSAVGRFLSMDSVGGGNANAYIYPDDPVNSSDTSGLEKIKHLTKDEIKALDKAAAGHGLSKEEKKRLKAAQAKIRFNEKILGTRNKQKRENEKSGIDPVQYVIDSLKFAGLKSQINSFLGGYVHVIFSGGILAGIAGAILSFIDGELLEQI